MKIEKFKIENYKSFKETDWIEFDSGFNLIVGKNNSGKTAMMESISLTSKYNANKFSPENHEKDPINKIEFRVDLNLLIKSLNDNNQFFLPHDINLPQEEVRNIFNEILEKRSFNLIIELDHNHRFIMGYIKEFGEIIENRFLHGKYISESNKFLIEKMLVKGKGYSSIEKIYNMYFAPATIYLESERFNLGSYKAGPNTNLLKDAQNLPEIINNLSFSNLEKINKHMKFIFPDIVDIYARNVDDIPNSEIFINYSTDYIDFEISLFNCGTGINQALAVLTAVVTSKNPMRVVIDEPQSFLHPEAIRKLFAILKKYYSAHQYFISTHSPTVINSINPDYVISLIKEDNITIVTKNSMNDINQLKSTLLNIGASFSDVFGVDSIIWVEGQTEEKCFPLIARELCKEELLSTKFFEVKNVDDLFQKDKSKIDLIQHIYSKFSKDIFLLPSKIKFIFDRDKLTKKEITDLNRYPRKNFSFLNRFMYENYLLIPEAIHSLLIEMQKGLEVKKNIPKKIIKSWIDENISNNEFFQSSISGKSNTELLKNIDGAKFLDKLVIELLGNGFDYKGHKPLYGEFLTNWIIDNKPKKFNEIVKLMNSIFPN